MEKKDIITFFDNLASGWDEGQTSKDAIIEKIFTQFIIIKFLQIYAKTFYHI